jgi:hypothetical protein
VVQKVGGEVRAAGRRGARGGVCCRRSSGVWALRIDSWRVCKAGRGIIRTGVAPAASNCGELQAHLRGAPGGNSTALVLLSWLGRWLRRRWDPAGTSWRLRRGGSASACGSRGNRGAGIAQRTRDRALSDPGLASRRRGVD